jgi:hypothetical protein
MAVYYDDEMKPGLMHDHIEAYSVTFWYTNDDGYKAKETVTMFIEDGDNWSKIEKSLKKRYKSPEIVSVKYQ